MNRQLKITIMELIWIPIAVGAALMQAVRTAAQKAINAHLSTWMTTYVRSLYGLPCLLVYLVAVCAIEGLWVPIMPIAYFGHVFGAAASQVFATVLLIRLFQMRNFAVGTMLSKTDVMQAALIGSILFSEQISAAGWIAIALTIAGVIAISVGRLGVDAVAGTDWRNALLSRSTQYGLATGLLFCLSYLFLREATLTLDQGGPVYRAAWTVVAVTSLQVVLVGVWVAWSERAQFRLLPALWRPCVFIGVTSALGSIGWFTAMAMENASYVKSVGQVEVVFTLMISTLYFRERITSLEFFGIAVIVAGVIMFVI